MIGWFVASTLPRQEERAEVNLRRQGFDPWLPRFVRLRRHARRVDTVTAPLFPGYLFVRLNPAVQPWRSINGTYGVRSLLTQDNRPTALPDAFVEQLQSSVNERGLIDMPEETLKPGSSVKLLGGAFADCIGTLFRLPDGDRVTLLIQVLGRQVSTTVSRHIVAPAG